MQPLLLLFCKQTKSYSDGRQYSGCTEEYKSKEGLHHEWFEHNHNYQSKYLDLPSQNEQSSSSTERIINGYDFLAVSERMDESLVVLAMLAQIPLTDVVVYLSKISGGYNFALNQEGCVLTKKKWTTPKIDEYIHGDYQNANKDDYLLYKAAQRSLDKTIDALGRKSVEENVELLRSLQRQNEEQCATKITMPCPEPDDEQKKLEHKRLSRESCYSGDFGCGHACTDLVLADHTEKEWTSITSSQGQKVKIIVDSPIMMRDSDVFSIR
mmetsp:Transcript_11831/g.16983  ORF Transcript_11831/g.16983 Transcript_11831/m.16983 type:complete len:268 (-) Transcript_11831:47-850(-)